MLVLASTSRHRKRQLEELGLAFEARSPKFTERFDPGRTPEQTALHFAEQKALSLGPDVSNAWIVGADQVLELDGTMFTKPGSAENAVRQLMQLSGRTHRLLTAVAVLRSTTGQLEKRLVVHEMRMRPFTERFAEKYVALDDPVDCVGAYKVEGRGAALFAAMNGSDHTAIVGLPITALVDLLDCTGFEPMEKLLQADPQVG